MTDIIFLLMISIHNKEKWLFQVARYMRLVGGELYSKEVLLVLFSFCFLRKKPGLTLIAAGENPQPRAVSDSPGYEN